MILVVAVYVDTEIVAVIARAQKGRFRARTRPLRILPMCMPTLTTLSDFHAPSAQGFLAGDTLLPAAEAWFVFVRTQSRVVCVMCRYSAPLYVDLTKTVTTVPESPDEEPEVEQEELPKVFIGKVPIMLRSQYCSLYDHTDKELAELGECPYDQARNGRRAPREGGLRLCGVGVG